MDETGVPWAQAITWMAIGIGNARVGNLDRAKQAEGTLASLREAIAATKNTYWSNQVGVQRREVAAWIAEQSGNHEDAVSGMRTAAELEESRRNTGNAGCHYTCARDAGPTGSCCKIKRSRRLQNTETVLQVAPESLQRSIRRSHGRRPGR